MTDNKRHQRNRLAWIFLSEEWSSIAFRWVVLLLLPAMLAALLILPAVIQNSRHHH